MQESLAQLAQVVQAEFVPKSKFHDNVQAAAADVVSASDAKTMKYVTGYSNPRF